MLPSHESAGKSETKKPVLNRLFCQRKARATRAFFRGR
jgi:hypothetical protein